MSENNMFRASFLTWNQITTFPHRMKIQSKVKRESRNSGSTESEQQNKKSKSETIAFKEKY